MKPSRKYELTFFTACQRMPKMDNCSCVGSFRWAKRLLKKLYNELDEVGGKELFIHYKRRYEYCEVGVTELCLRLGNINLWADFDEVRLVDITTGTSRKQLLTEDMQISYTVQGCGELADWRPAVNWPSTM